jgi:hypothetical protein
MSTLRSLFHISNSTGRTFRNPASGINGGTPAPSLLIPLGQAAYQAIQAATPPPSRLNGSCWPSRPCTPPGPMPSATCS